MNAILQDLPPVIREKIQRVQAIVKTRLNVDIPDEQIVEMHLRCLEPEILSKAIIFAITQDPIDSEDSDEEEVR